MYSLSGAVEIPPDYSEQLRNYLQQRLRSAYGVLSICNRS